MAKEKKVFPRIIDVVYIGCIHPYGMTGTYDINTEILTPDDPGYKPRLMPADKLYIGYPYYKTVYDVLMGLED